MKLRALGPILLVASSCRGQDHAQQLRASEELHRSVGGYCNRYVSALQQVVTQYEENGTFPFSWNLETPEAKRELMERGQLCVKVQRGIGEADRFDEVRVRFTPLMSEPDKTKAMDELKLIISLMTRI